MKINKSILDQGNVEISEINIDKSPKINTEIDTDSVFNASSKMSDSLTRMASQLTTAQKNKRKNEENEIEAEEKLNLENSRFISQTKIETAIHNNLTSMDTQSENYYENAEKMYSLALASKEADLESVRTSDLDIKNKATLNKSINTKYHDFNAKFRKNSSEHVKAKNNLVIEEMLVDKKDELMMDIARGEYANVGKNMEGLIKILDRTQKYIDDPELKQEYLSGIGKDIVIGHYHNLAERGADGLDLETIEGLNEYSGVLKTILKTTDSENFYDSVNELYGISVTEKNKSAVVKELQTKINSIVSKKEKMIRNKKSSVITKVKTDRLKKTYDPLKYYEKETGAPLTSETFSEESTLSYIIHAKDGIKVAPQDALEYAKENNLEFSLYKNEGLSILKSRYENGDFTLEDLEKEKDLKVGGGYLDPIFTKMFWKDMEKISGGEFDEEKFGAYETGNQEQIAVIESINKGVGEPKFVLWDLHGEDGILGFRLGSPIDSFNSIGKSPEMTKFYNFKKAFEDIDGKPNGETFTKITNSIDNVLNQNFFKSLDADQLAKFDQKDLEEKQDMIFDFYSHPENKEKLNKDVETIYDIYLGDNGVIRVGENSIIVNKKYMDYDHDVMLENAKEYKLYHLGSGKPISPSRYPEITLTGADDLSDGTVAVIQKNKVGIKNEDGEIVELTTDQMPLIRTKEETKKREGLYNQKVNPRKIDIPKLYNLIKKVSKNIGEAYVDKYPSSFNKRKETEEVYLNGEFTDEGQMAQEEVDRENLKYFLSIYNEDTNMDDIDDKQHTKNGHEFREILSRLYPEGLAEWDKITKAK